MFEEDKADQAYAGGLGVLIILIILALILFLICRSCETKPTEANEIDSLLPIIAMAESSYGLNLYGKDGEVGKWQISPICLKHYNQVHKTNYVSKDLIDFELNGKIARWYLDWLKKQLIKHNKYSIKRLVFAWNAGLSVALQRPVPKSHRNKIYAKIYQ